MKPITSNIRNHCPGISRKHQRNEYADLSALVSLASFIVFYLYGSLHSHLMYLEFSGGASAWLTWHTVDLVRCVQVILSIIAISLAQIAITKHPRRLGIYALITGAFAFYLSWFVFV